MPTALPDLPKRPQVLVIGAGFAGLALAKKLKNTKYDVTLLDRNNYNTFQPLLYQVATGGLEPDSIAYPIRKVLQGKANLSFKMAEVERIVPERKVVETNIGPIEYDYLVIATGSKTNFFNFVQQEEHLMGLKSVPEALNLRSFILQNFEKANNLPKGQTQSPLLNIGIVGGGPTGVELAGALGEMKQFVFPKDYPDLDLSQMRIVLLEAADRLLGGMPDAASKRALEGLQKLGVEVKLQAKVEDYDGKTLSTSDGFSLPTETLIWAAGVQGDFPLGINAEVIRGGNRIAVDEYNRILGYSDVFVLGDVAAMITKDTPRGYPMLAPVAIQQGEQLGKNLIRESKGQAWKPFRYLDKGNMATIGRNKAVVYFLGQNFGGFIAWLMWMFVHMMYLIGFRNKVTTLWGWIYNYFTYDRALRLIIRPFERKTRTRKADLVNTGA